VRRPRRTIRPVAARRSSAFIEIVMPALVDDKRGHPRLWCRLGTKTWMAGTSPALTSRSWRFA
jgi:hypothetical protein